MSFKPPFETQATREIYMRPTYIDRTNSAYGAQKPRPEPLRLPLLPAHSNSSAERVYQYH